MGNRIHVTLEGGSIESIAADSPELVDVIVLDLDTDGCDSDEIRTVLGREAAVCRWPSSTIDDVTEGVRSLATWMFGADPV